MDEWEVDKVEAPPPADRCEAEGHPLAMVNKLSGVRLTSSSSGSVNRLQAVVRMLRRNRF